MPCPRTQHNDLGQRSNPDRFTDPESNALTIRSLRLPQRLTVEKHKSNKSPDPCQICGVTENAGFCTYLLEVDRFVNLERNREIYRA